MSDACRFRGPYLPVGDLEWECLTHGVELRRVAGTWGTPAKRSDMACPVGQPDWALRVRWQAAPQTTIGGWCVQPENEKPTHEGGVEIACFVREADARHIAEVHNLWLDFQNVDVHGWST